MYTMNLALGVWTRARLCQRNTRQLPILVKGQQLTRISCSVQVAEAVSSLGMYLEFHTAAISDNEGLQSQSNA